MTKTLSQIISDGMLEDNSVYHAEAGAVCGGSFFSSLALKHVSTGPNRSERAWSLINKAATLNTENSKLVFRVPEADYEHNTDDAFVSVSGPDPLNFRLETGNLIGCVKSEGCTLRVSSRFGDEFLKYIIADADGFV